MDKIRDQYPDFQKNQLLTETSLNSAVNFLEQQERLTRFGSTKTGIMNGLSYIINKSNNGFINSIEIENGFGTSTDGFFIHHNYPLGKVIYSKCKPYTFTNDNPGLNFNILSQPPFEPDKDTNNFDSSKVTAYELLPADYNGKTVPILLKDLPSLKNPLIVLFLEVQSEGHAQCAPGSCDEGGKLKKYRVVPLIIENFYPGESNSIGIFPKINEWIPQKDYIRIKRLSKITSSNLPEEEFEGYFERTIFSGFIREINKLNHDNKGYLKDNLLNLFNIQQPVIEPTIFDDIKSIDENINFNIFINLSIPVLYGDNIFMDNSGPPLTNPPFPFPCQNFIGLCSDLELAINEFIKQYNLVNHKYFTGYPGRKRKFLVLGITEISQNDYYRYYSIEYYENYSKKSDLRKLKSLYERIFVLIKKFKENYNILYSNLGKEYINPAEIKIIPSKTGCVPLGERAIPYYYKRDGLIEKIWRGGENHISFNININNYYNSNAKNYLLYNIKENNFFRIEGIIGANADQAYMNLLQQKISYNYPFEVISVDIFFILTINQLIHELNNISTFNIDLIIRSIEFENLSHSRGKKINFSTPLKKFQDYGNCIKAKALSGYYLYPYKLLEQLSKYDNEFLNLDENLKKRVSNPTDKIRELLNRLGLNSGAEYKVPFFWGMEHIGGVERGGTYILVYKWDDLKHQNEVIADFSVPYLIEMDPLLRNCESENMK